LAKISFIEKLLLTLKKLKTMKTVHELTQDELDELRFTYFYNEPNDFDSPDEVPNSTIFEYFGDIAFVDEDFFCNID